MKEERERKRERQKQGVHVDATGATQCPRLRYIFTLSNQPYTSATHTLRSRLLSSSLSPSLVLGSFLFVKPHPRSILWHSNHPFLPFRFSVSIYSTPPRHHLVSLFAATALLPPFRNARSQGCRCCSDGVAGCRWTTLAITPSTKNLYVWIYNKKSEKQKERERKRAWNPYLCEPSLFLSFLFNVLSRL